MWKKLLLGALAIFVVSGCVGQGFDAGYEKFGEIKARYVVGEQFLPENEKELKLLQEELSALKDSSSNAALADLLGIELEKIEMQLHLVKARAELQGISLLNIDCSALQNGLGHLKDAVAFGSNALNLISDFQEQHPAEFLKAELGRERLRDIVLATQNTAAYANNLNQLAC